MEEYVLLPHAVPAWQKAMGEALSEVLPEIAPIRESEGPPHRIPGNFLLTTDCSKSRIF